MATAQETSCKRKVHAFNPFVHKQVYKVGVHAIRGLDNAFAENDATFGTYLSATAGQKFDPPVRFEVIPLLLDGVYNAIDNEELDFLYGNSGVYSCIGSEAGASALVTAVKHVTVRDKNYDLEVFGGVIATRADRTDINVIEDLRDKIIGAGSTSQIMAGQMQIYEMQMAGMNYVNDPKQVVFTHNQNDVVAGLLDGSFDVGFVRTSQIELTNDENGEPLDPDLFKVVSPQIYVMDGGDLFPFLHSTDVVSEWPLAALSHVPKDVTLAVQDALLDFGNYATVGKKLEECKSNVASALCESRQPIDYDEDAPCDTTWELAKVALAGSINGNFAAFRTPKSYWDVRTMLQNAGFMIEDDDGNWKCLRPSNIYEGITCPDGYFKRNKEEFHEGCSNVGLSAVCDAHPEWDCFCKPCVKAFDVDVYEHIPGQEDNHLVIDFEDELPGCAKMSICAKVEQGQTATLRIYDNMLRDDAQMTVIAHSSDTSRLLNVIKLPDPYAYEIEISDKAIGVQVIDVLVDGESISQSPIRVMVERLNCDAIHGEGSNLAANDAGECVCQNNTYLLGKTCVESEFFFLIIFAAVFAILGVSVFLLLSYKKKQSDSVWHVSVDELHFNEPPEIIGQGGFGVVVLGQYRGTKVAVKRVLPPSTRKARKAAAAMSGSFATGSQCSGSIEMPDPKKEAPRKGKKEDKKGVSFGADSCDIEAPTTKKFSAPTTSTSLSNKAWEEFLYMDSKYDNALKILESATLSSHGSGSFQAGTSSVSTKYSFIECLPLWMRFDEHSRLRKEFVNEMRLLSRLRHPCITTVMGAVVASSSDPMLVMEFMEYGSLYDILRNETMYAGGEIILQVIRDITQGIQFLHASKPPILHGDLKAKNILVDSRFRAKVADFGFSTLKGAKSKNVLQGTPFFMAPEYLRRKSEYTTQCDIYSLGMIFYEIYARADPFEGEDPRVMLPKICHPRVNKRPTIPAATPPKISDIIKKCWSANPFFRPTAKDIDYILVEMSSKEAEPMEMIQNEFKEGMARKPTSLYDVFPKHIADALNAGKRVEPESHEIVSVVFSDIVGFTTISQELEPMQVSKMLDRLYLAFDDIANKHKVFKVETIGDAYMGVTNIDGTQFDTHAKAVAEFAVDIVKAASTILIDEEDPGRGTIKIRAGFHSGPVVSNVIGSLNPRFGLFGDTVNTASRMESNSIAGRVHCTAISAKLLEVQAPELPCVLRGKIKVKGKGAMLTYWVGKMEDVNGKPAPLEVIADVSSKHDDDDFEEVTESEDDSSHHSNSHHKSHKKKKDKKKEEKKAKHHS